MSENLPTATQKQSLLEWLETFLPFKLPRIPLVQTAQNFDKAAASVVTATGENIVARIKASTTRIDTKSVAEKNFIELGASQIQLASGGIGERALHYALEDVIKKQKNREEILRLTSEHLQSDPPKTDASAEIDDDWLNLFKQYSETKTKADIQQIWAKILSAEIREPGTVSLRTMSFLSTASTQDAKLIVSAFSFVLNANFIPQFAHQKEFIKFSDYLSIEAMGILSGGYGIGGVTSTMKATPSPTNEALFCLKYFDWMAIVLTNKLDHTLQIQSGALTEIGKSLFALSDTKTPNIDFFEQFLLTLGKDPITKILIYTLSEGRVDPTTERALYMKPQ